MNLALIRKHRKKQGGFAALLSHNPVLVLGLDLPFIIVCSTTLKNAVALSIEMFLIHMVTVVAAMITVRCLPLWMRMLVNIGVAFMAMTVARALVTGIFPDISNYVGMYLYLMAVNGMTIYQAANITLDDKVWRVLKTALFYALAFTLTMLFISLFREYFAGGTLWGIPVPVPFKVSGLAMPFGGFIFMAFLLAGLKQLNKLMLALSIRESIRRDAKYTQLDGSPRVRHSIFDLELDDEPRKAKKEDDA